MVLDIPTDSEKHGKHEEHEKHSDVCRINMQEIVLNVSELRKFFFYNLRDFIIRLLS